MELPFLHSGGLVNFNIVTKFNSQTPCPLPFVGPKLRDSASLYSRVEVSKAQVADVETLCQDYFKATVLSLNGVNPTVWTLDMPYQHITWVWPWTKLNARPRGQACEVGNVHKQHMQSEEEFPVANCLQI